MSTVEHYRKQAAECRKLAADQPGSRHAERWRLMGDNYDLIAVALEKRLGDRAQRLLRNAGLIDGKNSRTT
jgi:hypothetical protein